MKIARLFTIDSKPVEDQIEWKLANSRIPGAGFEMNNIEVPKHWSQTAINILAQKYLRKAEVPHRTARYKEDRIPKWLQRSTGVNIEKNIFNNYIEDEGLGGETSAKQVFHRLAGHWTYVGWNHGYFKEYEEPSPRDKKKGIDLYDNVILAEQNARAFYDELYYMLAMQFGAPNSPQWFNSGLWWAYGIEGPNSGQWITDYEISGNNEPVLIQSKNSYEYPQPHACFIQPVNDDLVNSGGIMDLAVREVRLFKHGSGTGTNFSNIRAVGEPLSGGGKSSGLMSFLEILDRAAGSIKSGGTTRRAAKMVCLDLDHPEIEDFINWKVREEAKAAAMAVGSEHIRNGSDPFADPTIPQAIKDRIGNSIEMEEFSCSWEGEAIRTVSGQNSNNSVRVTDNFLKLVDDNQDWTLYNRTNRKIAKSVAARDLWNQICRAAWASADPGVQFDDTINAWNTCVNDGRINASNPCFVGSTLVDTSEGLISIEELAYMDYRGQKLPYAFGFDRNSALPALRRITKAWCSGYRNELVNVKLDTGEEFTCTPDHKWLLRNGKYIEAQNLKPGMSFRKVGRTINEERSVRCSILHRCTDEVPNGTQYQSRWMWEQVYGPIPNGFEVHHKDDDPTNDRLSNLELIEKGDHQINHMSGSNNPRYIAVSDKALVETYDAVIAAAKYKTKSGVTVGKWNAYIRANNLAGKIPQAQSPSTGGKIQGMYWHEFVAKMERLRTEVNARVVNVTSFRTHIPVAVYDLTVEGIHNFGIRGNKIRNQPSVIVSNCGEYNFLDNTACNLASLNLVKFLKTDGSFDAESFTHAARLWTIVLDISVSMASFPSREIALGSYNYRTLGLGYANVGGLLMRSGIPYDSDEGRDYIESITALMHGTSYATSTELAVELGPFPRWEANKESMENVLHKHWTHVRRDNNASYIWYEARKVWDSLRLSSPFRNAQTTLIAPTGTIALLMDCDTTGIEPEFSLKKIKSMAGGGTIETVNQCLWEGLRRLDYKEHEINVIANYLETEGNIETAPYLKTEHVPVFDCAVPAATGERFLSPMAHVKMVAAVQPFLSGAASKTVNLPNSATIADIDQIYREAHRLGIKSIALYRDGSKLTQPLNVERKDANSIMEKRISQETEIETKDKILWEIPSTEADSNYNGDLSELRKNTKNDSIRTRISRRRLPPRRGGYTQKVKIDAQSLHIRTGEYDDGTLGEIWLDFQRNGSTLGGILNAFAKSISIGLQYGVPLEEFVESFVHTKFEPAGIVQDHDRIKLCASLIDFVFRDLAITYLGESEYANVQPENKVPPETYIAMANGLVDHGHKPTGEICSSCGGQLIQAGTCKVCISCGSTNGGCG